MALALRRRLPGTLEWLRALAPVPAKCLIFLCMQQFTGPRGALFRGQQEAPSWKPPPRREPPGKAIKGQRRRRGRLSGEKAPPRQAIYHQTTSLVCPRASAGAGRHHLSSNPHEDRHAPLVDAVDRVLDLICADTIQHECRTRRQPDLLRTRSVLPEEATAVLLLVSR